MTNSILIEGVMTAGLTLNGRFTIENVLSEGGEEKRNVFLCKLAPALSGDESTRGMFKNGSTFRLVGYLSKDTDGDPMVMVDYFERLSIRSGKYNFALEN